MDITIKNEEYRFGCRTVAIIFNNDMTKILAQKMKDIYMLPGGRLQLLEDSKTAIERELQEELNIFESVKLKYSAESFLLFPNGQKYHELGYYYLLKIDEKKYGLDNDNSILNKDYEHDGNIYFEWLEISNIDNYKIIPKNIVEKIKEIKSIDDDSVEHLIYREI